MYAWKSNKPILDWQAASSAWWAASEVGTDTYALVCVDKNEWFS